MRENPICSKGSVVKVSVVKGSGWSIGAWQVLLLAGVLLLVTAALLPAQDRVPRPEFESGYVYPELTTPTPRSLLLEYFDAVVLLLCLGIASYLALKQRSRTGLFILSLFSMLYFGFFRKGCVCPVGSLQNIAYGLFNPGYAIPAVVIVFFALPLIFTLLFGRTFCAAVCPLGAIQDLVVFRPMRLPGWLTKPLSFFPVLYLGLAALLAATGTDFIICRFDPFISIYRFGGPFKMHLLGGAFLVLGIFVARPYCRFFCPYGVLLNWISRLSWRHAKITPDQCIHCRLCERACPVEAIRKPNSGERIPVDGLSLGRDRKRVIALIVVFPLMLAAGGYLGSLLDVPLSRLHADVRLADQIIREDSGSTVSTLESETFRGSRTTPAELFARVDVVVSRFRLGSMSLGIFLTLVLWLGLLLSYMRRERLDYEIDRGECVSCGRCFTYCPREHDRRKKIREEVSA